MTVRIKFENRTTENRLESLKTVKIPAIRISFLFEKLVTDAVSRLQFAFNLRTNNQSITMSADIIDKLYKNYEILSEAKDKSEVRNS